jgi:hypothetical protein
VERKIGSNFASAEVCMKRKLKRGSYGKTALAVVALAIGLPTLPAFAQVFVSGSTGADGAFNPACTPPATTCTITVQLPPSGIFNYTTVNIPTGVTVKYTRNQANTPVTILTTGDVTIAGTIDVSGGNASGFTPGKGGPGGFDGGVGGTPAHLKGSAGLGPGGGPGGDPAFAAQCGGGGATVSGCGWSGGYANAANGPGGPGTGGASYGSALLFPLIGGSGGGGGAGGNISDGPGGGGGGGAILIASSGMINFVVNGGIRADHGPGTSLNVNSGPIIQVPSGCGSAGAIRLIANVLTGNSSNPFTARFSSCSMGGSDGRIRVEGFQLTGIFSGSSNGIPPATRGVPGQVPVLPSANFPSVKITAVGGSTVPPNPQATFLSVPDTSLDPNATPNPVTVNLQATNVMLGTVLAVSVVTEGFPTATTVNSTPLAGTLSLSTATANVTLPPGVSVITARATFAAAP